MEYGNADPTSRSVQRADAAALIAAGNTHVLDPAQVWGDSEYEDDLKLFGNFGKLLANGVQVYGHANYAEKTATQGFYYRNPNTRANIFSNDGGRTLLVGDALDAQDGVRDGSAGCPTVTITDDRPDQDALAQVLADPNCFTFQEIAPGGFTPYFSGVMTDTSAVAGLRRTMKSGLTWDASAGYGSHEADFFLFNTVNASLGPASPRDFDPGVYRQAEVNLNFDLSYAVSELLHLAGGAEWRDERFTIRSGELPSWQVGPYAAQGFVSGSNGFPGFPDYTAGTWNRANAAVYGDLELRDTDGRWTVGGALRFEHFDVFGNTTNGKLSARFALTDTVSVRGGVSTGFRAPTPGQQNVFNVQSTINPETLDLVDSATVPSTFRAAQFRGGQALEPETSTNATAGVVVDKPGGQHPAGARDDALGRRSEPLRYVLGSGGPVRGAVRPAIQPVHALGPGRGLLLCAPPPPVGPIGAGPNRRRGGRLVPWIGPRGAPRDYASREAGRTSFGNRSEGQGATDRRV